MKHFKDFYDHFTSGIFFAESCYKNNNELSYVAKSVSLQVSHIAVRLRLESIRLRPIWQLAYVLMLSLTQIYNRVDIPRSKKGAHKHNKYRTATIVV